MRGQAQVWPFFYGSFGRKCGVCLWYGWAIPNLGGRKYSIKTITYARLPNFLTFLENIFIHVCAYARMRVCIILFIYKG